MPRGAGSTSQPSIILIGLRASGKTTLARDLASLIDPASPPIDLDDLTPRILGEESVAAAFSRHGESLFRAAEFKALSNLLPAPGRIIALGGGTPTAPGAAQLLRAERDAEHAIIIYLRATPAALRTRLKSADNSHRPPLLRIAGDEHTVRTDRADDILNEVDQLFAARDPLYRSLASLIIDTSKLTPPQAAAAVLAELRLMGISLDPPAIP